MPLAVGSEEAVDQQPRAAILKLVAFLAEAGNALIRWADAFNFTANVLSVLPREGFCGLLRISAARDEDRDLPLILSFAGARPGNLGGCRSPSVPCLFPFHRLAVRSVCAMAAGELCRRVPPAYWN